MSAETTNRQVIAEWRGPKGSKWTASLERIDAGIYDAECGYSHRCSMRHASDDAAIEDMIRWLRDVHGYTRIYRSR